MSFETLGLARPLLKVLERQGFMKPTPIQEQSIPLVLRGKDIVGLAQTGTGKTAAFTLPVLHLLCASARTGKFRPVRMLVLSPTRELAAQVDRVIKDFASAVNLKSVPIFGGVPFFFEMLKKLNFHKFNLKNLKHITQAGGKLNLETLKYIYKKTKE